jgi:hypothetical protein
MLRTGGRHPHEVSGKASNTCPDSHLARASNPLDERRSDSEMASEVDWHDPPMTPQPIELEFLGCIQFYADRPPSAIETGQSSA